MPSFAQLAYYAAIVAWSASLYQFFLKDFLAVTAGLGRHVQAIEEFPYECRRLVHEKLEACEDLWIDEEKRVLYAACAGTQGRIAWSPAVRKLNTSGRRARGSELIALDIDSPGKDGLFGMRVIKPVGYDGPIGDGTFDSNGFDVDVVDLETLHVYIVNLRPPVDENKNFLDAEELGANTTVEVFELKRGQDEMRHLRTVASPAVFTANRPVALGGGAFLVSNDHGIKVGLKRELEMIIGGGNIAYCSPAGECHNATPNTRLKLPNGLTKGRDGLIYVPSSVDGTVKVFSLQSNKTLKLENTINTGIPLDNISPDLGGHFYAAAFPNAMRFMEGTADPYGTSPPSTVMRIEKIESEGEVEYLVEKHIEDKEGKIIGGATTARHDVTTGRLFISAVAHPFLVVCDHKDPVLI